MFKQIVKQIVPSGLYEVLKRWNYKREIQRENKYWDHKLLHYSSTFNNSLNTKLSTLSIVTHVLEKGITMPERRLGFGYERVRDIIKQCRNIVKEFGSEYIEFQAAFSEY